MEGNRRGDARNRFGVTPRNGVEALGFQGVNCSADALRAEFPGGRTAAKEVKYSFQDGHRFRIYRVSTLLGWG